MLASNGSCNKTPLEKNHALGIREHTYVEEGQTYFQNDGISHNAIYTYGVAKEKRKMDSLSTVWPFWNGVNAVVASIRVVWDGNRKTQVFFTYTHVYVYVYICK